MGKIIRVNRISQQKIKRNMEEKQFSTTSLSSSKIEREKEDTSPVSLQSISMIKDVNFVEKISGGSVYPRNPHFNKLNRLKSTILPSIRPPIHSRRYHRRRRQHFSTRGKKPIPSHLNHEEEYAFDADVEDSDSSPGTSKTSTMSCGSAEEYLMNLDQNELVTPPRRFINSSQLIECSPLSSSLDSMSSSSSSGDCTSRRYEIKSECLKKKKQEFLKKISLGVYSLIPFREVLNRIETKLNAKWKLKKNTKEMVEGMEGCNKREKVKTSKQKMNPLFRITKEMIFRLAIIIFVYSIATVFMTTTKLLQIQSDDVDVQLKRFKSTKIHTSDPVLVFDYENQNNYPNSIFQGNSKVMIKRTLGGLRSIKRFEVKDRKLDKPNRLESLGLGHLDVQMYNTKQNLVVSPKSKRPRIFHFHQSKTVILQSHIVRELSLYPTIFSDNTQLYGIRDSGDPALSKMELVVEDENEECVPMAEWQSTYHPTCNSIHELDLGHMDGVTLVGKKGYWRNAWRVDIDSSQHIETMILKTPRYDHNFERDYYEHDRVDAQAMERKTFSPHVINIYGFCGRSVTSEFADGPRLGTLVDKSRKHPLKRLEIARDIAVGLSHVHYGRSEENASFVHLDVNPANIVVVDNTLKLNDFNIGIMLKRNTTSGLPCGFPAQYPNAQWRSPEEANDSSHLNEKIDVFSMGHIFFRMICGHEPWNKLEVGGKPSSTTLVEKVKRGILPRIPDYIMNTTIVEERVILDAMLASYTLNPDERPSSRDIAKFLDYQFANLSRGSKFKS